MKDDLRKIEEELLAFNNSSLKNTEIEILKKSIEIEDKDIKGNKEIEDRRTILDMSKEDRPREKMQILGSDSLSIEELIAIIIGTGSLDDNALELGHKIHCRLLEENNFLDITIEELMEIKGVGLAKASKIKAGLELGRRLNISQKLKRFSITHPKYVADVFLDDLNYEMKEYFYILLLDTKNRIISKEKISEGSLNAAIVHPREVFKPAIKKSSNAIILVHNHPSGDISPSVEDINITHRLMEVGEIVGIKVLDHIIIGDGQYLSLKENKYI